MWVSVSFLKCPRLMGWLRSGPASWAGYGPDPPRGTVKVRIHLVCWLRSGPASWAGYGQDPPRGTVKVRNALISVSYVYLRLFLCLCLSLLSLFIT